MVVRVADVEFVQSKSIGWSMLSKADFQRELRERLINDVPLAQRSAWRPVPDLMIWWLKVEQEATYLRPTGYSGDLWQEVDGICSDLIGPDAIQ